LRRSISTFIHAGTVPAVNIEAERNLFDQVELVGHTVGSASVIASARGVVPAQKEKWFWNWFAGQDRA